jgi:glutamate synthase domain-containing protein 3
MRVSISLQGDANVFTGNTISQNYGTDVLYLDGGTGNTVTGNTVHIGGGRTFVSQIAGASSNAITPNTVD